VTLLVTQAVVLHAFDYLETSRILRLATRESGVLSVIARGARRSVRRFGSAMDLFAEGTAEIEHRPGRDLHALRSFDVTHGRSALALDLDRFAAASMLCELVLRCSGGDEHGEVYQELSRALTDLQARRAVDARAAGLARAWRLIGALGFAPALTACASCHRPLDADDELWFHRGAGGALCPACADSAMGMGRRLPAVARATLQAWLSGGDADSGDAPTQRAHVRLLREFIERHVAEGGALSAFDAWSARFRVPS
jgi:DNA repair protein RecO (recombination protein O)